MHLRDTIAWTSQFAQEALRLQEEHATLVNFFFPVFRHQQKFLRNALMWYVHCLWWSSLRNLCEGSFWLLKRQRPEKHWWEGKGGTRDHTIVRAAIARSITAAVAFCTPIPLAARSIVTPLPETPHAPWGWPIALGAGTKACAGWCLAITTWLHSLLSICNLDEPFLYLKNRAEWVQ